MILIFGKGALYHNGILIRCSFFFQLLIFIFLQLVVLQDEILFIFRQPNFATLLCQIYENGKRLALLQAENRVPEEYSLTAICKHLKFSASQTLAFAYALSLSKFKSVELDAKALLKLVFPQVTTMSDLQEDIVDAVVHLVSTSTEYCSAEVSKNLLQIATSTRHADVSLPKKQVTISSFLKEQGFACTATPEKFRATLREYGAPISETHVAHMIATFLPHVKLNNDNSKLYSLFHEGGDKVSWWNMDAIITVLSTDFSNLNAQTIARQLDTSPDLYIISDVEYNNLMTLYSRVTRQMFPVDVLLTLWQNHYAQLNMLIFGVNTLNFQHLPNPITIEADVPTPPTRAWCYVALYNILLELASHGYANDVLRFILEATTQYPEYVFLGLAQVNDPYSGVRAEILRRMLPLFTGISGSRATSLVIMNKLIQVNTDLLIVLCRMAYKRSQTLADIVAIENHVKSFGVLGKRVLEESTIDEVLGLWCVMADRGEFNLEEKFAPALENNPNLAKVIFSFAKTHVENLRPKSAPAGGIVSFERFAVLLRLLQPYSSIIPAQDLRSLTNAMIAQQQKFKTEEKKPVISEDIEEIANSYFQKIYTADISIPDVIQLLKKFKASTDMREQEIFRSMIHNLFDEYRFFHKYPEKELQVTGKLFGTLIQYQLVSSITLGIALRYVLEALRKDPEAGGSNEKMFRFGKISLEQFRSRLSEWPQYCSHLVQIPHLPKHCIELYNEAQRAISNPPTVPPPTSTSPLPKGESKEVDIVTKQLEQSTLGPNEPKEPMSLEGEASCEAVNLSKRDVLEKMILVNTEVPNNPVPPENVRDQIHFIVNNIAKSNLDTKGQELREMLIDTYHNWFANYLIVKRVSAQPNLHVLYLALVDIIESPALNKVILNSTYHNVTKLLNSSKITTSSSERSLLRNLGIWIGMMTLARNKPILHTKCNLKELLLWGYETGKLIAVCSFVAKIMESCRESKIFHPPNPWLMGILSVMRELYEIEDLKMNIKFEVQVLCNNIGVKIEEIPRTSIVAKCTVPIKDKNPDFNVKVAAATTATPPIQQTSPVAPSMDDDKQGEPPLAPLPEQTVIPQLATQVQINPSLQIFAANPNLRRSIPVAVDRAIREIIQPVVDRSVTIACVTSQHVILKDFAHEANENTLRRAAHMMISNLAGSLALVTCKEPLRVSIGNHIRSLLAQANVDPNHIEQVVQVCSAENLELGCRLIEKAATEKAIRDIDEALTSAIQIRRKCRETGAPFTGDSSQVPVKGSRFPKELPDFLKMPSTGLQPQQAQIYEAFQRRAQAPPTPPLQQASPPMQPQISPSPPLNAIASGSPSLSGLPAKTATVPGASYSALTMAQSLEAYQYALSRVDSALKMIMQQAQGREITLAMLGGEHEILALLRDIILITQRIQPAVRNESAMTFAESVFKRLAETASITDTLRLEVMVGILEALRDACGGGRKFAPDMVSWMNHYISFNLNDETSRKLHQNILTLLLRAKLLRAQDIDIYFAGNVDAGRNMLWVEVALQFIRQGLADNLVVTYDFPNIFDIVSKMRPTSMVVRKQLQKWITDIRAIASAKEENKAPVQPTPTTAAASPSRDNTAKAAVMHLLEKWMRIWNAANDQLFGQYLQLMHQFGVLKTEEAADKFFLIATDVCVEACLKSATPNETGAATLVYTVIDALSKLFLLLVRLADKEAGDAAVRVNLLSRILHAIAKMVLEDYESKKNSHQMMDQRPYYRLFANLMQDFGPADPKQDTNPNMLPLLATYWQTYMTLQPTVIPCFAFAWLQLVSHRSFLPHLLKIQKGWPYMHRLLLSLLQFLHPFLRTSQLTEPVRKLYKGTLRVLLVLLHDFPEFLCDYHLSLCDAIPVTCIQLRNLILSAFPRSMRLPDPFTPNLKVDLLPEISQPPRILTDFVGILTERGIRQKLESYLSTKQPSDFLPFLSQACFNANGALNTSLLTAIVIFIAIHAISQQQQQKSPIQISVAIEIYKYLIMSFDAENRYMMLNTMVNQLRFPNNHTHYFSCVILVLFNDAENEMLQEQITRVLLERLIVHRPHPVCRFF